MLTSDRLRSIVSHVHFDILRPNHSQRSARDDDLLSPRLVFCKAPSLPDTSFRETVSSGAALAVHCGRSKCKSNKSPKSIMAEMSRHQIPKIGQLTRPSRSEKWLEMACTMTCKFSHGKQHMLGAGCGQGTYRCNPRGIPFPFPSQGRFGGYLGPVIGCGGQHAAESAIIKRQRSTIPLLLAFWFHVPGWL
jgi:hypothetical protein